MHLVFGLVFVCFYLFVFICYYKISHIGQLINNNYLLFTVLEAAKSNILATEGLVSSFIDGFSNISLVE